MILFFVQFVRVRTVSLIFSTLLLCRIIDRVYAIDMVFILVSISLILSLLTLNFSSTISIHGM